MKGTVLFLVKFFKADKAEHADAFIAGKLFMNRLSYFRDIERAGERADRHEATAMWLQPHHLSITFENHPQLNIGPQDLASPISVTFDSHDDLHIFCMSAMQTDFEFVDGKFDLPEDDVRKLKDQLEFSDRCLSLGDIAVVVRVDEFINRFKRAVNKRGLRFATGLVEYYDPETFHGKFTVEEVPFRKRLEFSHEREFRIVIDSRTTGRDALEVEIGDISDISARMPSASLNKQFEVKRDE